MCKNADAAWGAGFGRTEYTPPMRWIGKTATRGPAALALSLAVLLAGCGDTPRPSILLVTLDTTRADHLGTYGHPSVRTPVLDRIARQGALLELAIADVPVTLPSHTTIMTGLPAVGHGVRYNGDFRVSERAETLAERMAALGWDTGAVVSSLVLHGKFGLGQGFRTFDDALPAGYVKYDESIYPTEFEDALPAAERRADQVTESACAWLAGAKPPFFLWTHYYDAHAPFDPPPPWRRTLDDPYLAEIQFADRELGRLVRVAEASAVRARDASVPARLALASLTIVITADHGEGLDQHREDRHGILVYDDVMRVPLVVRAVGVVPGGVVLADQVRTMDVASTVLDLAGDRDALGLGGSLVPLLQGTGPAPDSVAYIESEKSRLFYNGSGLKGLRTRNRKYIHAPRPELYDLEADPGEARDLAAGDAAQAAEWDERLEAYVQGILAQGVAVAEGMDLDEETAARLRSLGYLSGAAPMGPRTLEEEMDLPGLDPKDLVDAVLAGRDVENGFHRRALEKTWRFERLVTTPEAAPELTLLWSMMLQNRGLAQMALGEYDEAAASYREALRHERANAVAREGLPYALNLAGRSREAERAAIEILANVASAWRVRLHHGLALALLGRQPEALVEFSRIVDECPDSETREVAKLYRTKVGTEEEEQFLDLYLSSAGHATH